MIGTKVKVVVGASHLMKSSGHWIKDYPETIDGLVGTIVNDYTYLKGYDCHYEVDFDEVKGVGIHPNFLTGVIND